VTATRRRGDDGSVLLLTIGCVVVAAALLVVVAAASQVFLARQALAAATDALALRAAQAADLDALYAEDGAGPEGHTLPLDRRAARAAVADHVERAGLAERFDGFEVTAVEVAGDTVTVRTRAAVRLVLAGPATGGRASVEVTAESSARSRVR